MTTPSSCLNASTTENPNSNYPPPGEGPHPGDHHQGTDWPLSTTRNNSRRDSAEAGDTRQAPTKPFQRGLRRTAEERQAKLAARSSTGAVAVLEHQAAEAVGPSSVLPPHNAAMRERRIAAKMAKATTNHQATLPSQPPRTTTLPPSFAASDHGLRRNATTNNSKGIQRGLRRTAEERRAKLQARTAKAGLKVERPPSEVGLRACNEGLQRGFSGTAEGQEAKQEARKAQAAAVETTTCSGDPTMAPLRGLAKNREQMLNRSPDPPTTNAHGRGLRKNAPPQRESTNGGREIEDVEPCLTETPENQESIPQDPDEEVASVASTAPAFSYPATDPPVPPTTTSRPNSITSSSTGLVVAQPVQEDPASLMEAQEVGPEELQREDTRKAKERECQFIGCAIVVICCAVLALMLGFKLGKKDEEKALPIATTMAPSDAPSSAPSGALDLLLKDLPNYTLESLNSGAGTSAQWSALQWLEDHPEVRIMEEWRKKQLFALATFYYAMEGPSWPEAYSDDWLQYSDECNWWSREFGVFNWFGQYSQEDNPPYNVAPCNERKEFQNIYLVGLELGDAKPFVPPEISLLTSLSILALPANNINASIADYLPTQLYQMSNLTELNLYANSLWGPIPSGLGLLTSMVDMRLYGNALTGPIPTELGMLTSVTDLLLYHNGLSGTIPSELGMMSNIAALHLDHNDLTGHIPSELGLLTSTLGLYLYENSLSGSIPNELGMMAFMVGLYLSGNLLTGPIPTELGLLTSFSWLFLDHNSFSGLIPSELGMLTSLLEFNLEHNSFSGPIPIEVWLLFSGMQSLQYSFDEANRLRSISSEIGLFASSLEMLDMHSMSLTGSIPSELGLLTRSTVFNLNDNSLYGSIPTELGMMTNTVDMRLQSNVLTGHIPSELGLLTNVAHLYLYHNSLSGFIPIELGMMTSMVILELNQNALTGPIPTELGLLTSMTDLGLHSNTCTGLIPSELGMMTAMVDLKLRRNALTGPVPTELGLLTSSRELHLRENSLSGSIQSELGLLTSLSELNLGSNAFSGPIPIEIIALLPRIRQYSFGGDNSTLSIPSEIGLLASSTKNLELSGMSLFGPIPTELGLMTSARNLDLSRNGLSGPIPTTLGMLTSTTKLDLSDNVLSGSIPSQLGMLTTMVDMSLHLNALTGPIPDELDALAFNGSTEILTLANNSLSGTVLESLCSIFIFDSSLELGLSFDCSGRLCGCCWCPCPGSNSSGLCRTHRVEYADKWPGRFPTSINAITINVRTDQLPEETKLEWSLYGGPGQWELLDSHNPEVASGVNSYTKNVDSDALYRLRLSDTYGDGTCCGANGLGWFAITDSTPSQEYAEGSVVWNVTGDAFKSSLDVFLWIDAQGHAQEVEYLPGQGYALIEDESEAGRKPTIVLSEPFRNSTVENFTSVSLRSTSSNIFFHG